MRYILLLLFFCSSAVHAQSLRLVHIKDYSQVSKKQFQDSVKLASAYFADMGITFRVQEVKYTVPCTDFPKFADTAAQLECMKKYMEDTGHLTSNRRKLFYFLVPRWNYTDALGNPGFTLGGRAIGLCAQVALGSADTLPGLPGVGYKTMNGTILAHEIAHLMCAEHSYNGINLMNPNVLTILRYRKELGLKRMPILRITKRQIKRWYAQTRRLA